MVEYKKAKAFYLIPALVLMVLSFCLFHTKVSAADPQIVNNRADAGTVIRNQMLDHQSIIKVYYQSEELYEKVENYTTEGVYFTNFTKVLFDEVYKYDPTNSKTGDYLERNTTYQITNIKTYSADQHLIELSYFITYKMTADQEAFVDSEINKILSTLALSSKSDHDKIKAIYDYLCSNITYEDHAVTAYSALANHSANCQGFSTLLYRMLLSSGLESRIIIGTLTDEHQNKVAHSWNIVKYNGSWYSLDATLDRYENSGGSGNYKFFMQPGTASNDDGLAYHEREVAYKGAFYDVYPMAYQQKVTIVKTDPYVYARVNKATTTVKYKTLKKKSVTVSPLTISCNAPLNCSIIPSKYSKYFSISKTTGKITVKKLPKKNKPKKKTYSLKICISTDPTDYLNAATPTYKTIKIKIK